MDAFVRFYFLRLNVAFNTSEAGIIRQLSDPICTTCRNYATSLDANKSEVVEGDSFVITSVAVPPVNLRGTIVEVFGETPARRLLKRDGTLVKPLPATGTFHFQMNVVRHGAGWLVRGIRFGGNA